MCGKPLHTLYPVLKMAQKYTLSHKNIAKIQCFKRTLKGILPHDTLSHNFLINCNSLSHNFHQKRTPCRITFTAKGHPVERHIPSIQVWEYPPPRVFRSFSVVFAWWYCIRQNCLYFVDSQSESLSFVSLLSLSCCW